MTHEEKRKMKYPDTKWFHYHNVNPKGKITTDCVYRAISNAMQIPYAQVAREMTEMQIETGWDTGESRLIDKYITSKGWQKHNQLYSYDEYDKKKKYTGKEFVDRIQQMRDSDLFKPCRSMFDRVIMNIGSEHLSCIVNGKIEDIWNCSNNCVGVWWSAKV